MAAATASSPGLPIPAAGTEDVHATASTSTATAISDEALLEEIQRRGLLPAAAMARVHSPGSSHVTQPMSRVHSPPGARIRSPDSRASTMEGPCLVEPGPRGGPLAPGLVTAAGRQQQLFRVLETGGLRGSVEYSWEMDEGREGQEGGHGHEQHGGHAREEHGGHGEHGRRRSGHHKRVARLNGHMAELFGRTSVHVCGRDGHEVFKLQNAAASWNPVHLHTSFRILPAGSEDGTEALFTVNRDVIGRGPLGLREQWRVFRGRARDNEVVYYCIGASWGWEYHFYKSQADHDEGKEAVATLVQAHRTGIRCEETGVWLPAEFDLTVGPGEDGALLLAVATILDVVHERSQPPSVV